MKAAPMLGLRCSLSPLLWTQRLFGRTESIGHRRSSGRLLLAPAGFGALLLLFQAFAPASAAQTCTWNPVSGSWDNAANWTTCNGTYPGTGTSAGADATVVNGDAVLTTGNLSVGTLTIGNSSYGLAEVQIIGSSATHDSFAAVTVNAGDGFNLYNGVSVTIAGALTMNAAPGGSDYTQIDGGGSEGGSTLNVGGTLTNSSGFYIGNTNLSAATNVSAAALTNTGTIQLSGNTSNATQATLNVAGAAGFGTAGQVTGIVNLQGDALLEFASGGLNSIASGGQLALNGANARVSIGAGTTNSALTGLASNAGTLYMQNGASVTTTGDFTNSNIVYVDRNGGEGGSTLNVGGTLTNSSELDIGNTNLTAATKVSAAGLTNTGTINLSGNTSNGTLATLTVNGNATNAGTVNVNAYSALDVTGANNSYIQSAGTTTVAANGRLSGATIAIDGGTLQGSGTLNGNVTNANVFGNATVAAGITDGQPATLTINGSFYNGFSTGGNGGTVASYLNASGNTQITITGVPHLAGGTIQDTSVGLAYAAGQSFKVMNFAPGTLSGLFSSVQNTRYNAATAGTSTDLGNGLTLGVVYNDHAGNIQFEVVNTPTTTTETWNGGTGNFNTASGWSSGAAPQFYSNVTIGATGSGNVTLGQDATIQSLAIKGGNTLAYDTSTPATLTVGGDVTVQTGGAITATTGDKLVLGGNFSNAGTTTLGSNASLNGLGKLDNTGSVAISGSSQVLGSATNGAGATITLSNGSFASTTLANAGTISGSGQLISSTSAAITNTGLVEASGGTLHAYNGIQGSTGNITVDAGATLDLSQSTAGSSAATLSQNGTLKLGSQNITVSNDYANANFGSGNSFNPAAGVTGTGQILASGNVAQAISGSSVTGGVTATPTLAFGNVHVGSSANTSYTIGNTGTSGPALRGAIQTSVNGGNVTDAGLSGSGVSAGNYGPVTTGAHTSGYVVTYAPTAAGALSGQTVHIANNFANVNQQTLDITGAAYAYASPTVNSSLNPQYNFGVVQVGQSYHDALNIANTLTASNAAYQEGLNASFGSSNNAQLTGAGSITNLGAGLNNSGAMVVNLNPVTAGTVGGTITLNFASNGAGTSGLGITNLASQNANYTWAFTGTVVNQASPSITPNPVDFGNVRINSAQAQALSVANLTTTAPQASLDAQLQTPTGAATSNNLTSISQLAAGNSNNTSFVLGLNTAHAGAQSGAAVINLQSDSTPNGCTSNCIVNLTPDTVNVSGNVYRLASPTLNTSSVTLAARVGDAAPTATISVTNTSPDTYTEGLAASLGAAPTGFTSSGSITNVAAQGMDNSSLKVGLNTATAGTFSGNDAVSYTSNGQIDHATPISVGTGNVALAGKVYTPAVAQVNTTGPVNFGIVHVGDGGGTLSQAISVTNAAATTALNDVLLGSASASGAGFSTSGSLSGLAAGQTSTAMQLSLNTATAGVYNGSTSLAFASHDADLADLALAGTTLDASAQVNRYAALGFNIASGLGSLSGSAANGYTLNLGNLLQNGGTGGTMLAFLNANPLADQFFTDLLSSQGTVSSGSGFSLIGDSVSNLAGGDSQGGFDIGLGTGTLGFFQELLKFNVNSSNGSGYNSDIGTVQLMLQGNVVATTTSVPEPSSLGIFGGGLGIVLVLLKKRRRSARAKFIRR